MNSTNSTDRAVTAFERLMENCGGGVFSFECANAQAGFLTTASIMFALGVTSTALMLASLIAVYSVRLLADGMNGLPSEAPPLRFVSSETSAGEMAPGLKVPSRPSRLVIRSSEVEAKETQGMAMLRSRSHASDRQGRLTKYMLQGVEVPLAGFVLSCAFNAGALGGIALLSSRVVLHVNMFFRDFFVFCGTLVYIDVIFSVPTNPGGISKYRFYIKYLHLVWLFTILIRNIIVPSLTMEIRHRAIMSLDFGTIRLTREILTRFGDVLLFGSVGSLFILTVFGAEFIGHAAQELTRDTHSLTIAGPEEFGARLDLAAGQQRAFMDRLRLLWSLFRKPSRPQQRSGRRDSEEMDFASGAPLMPKASASLRLGRRNSVASRARLTKEVLMALYSAATTLAFFALFEAMFLFSSAAGLVIVMSFKGNLAVLYFLNLTVNWRVTQRVEDALRSNSDMNSAAPGQSPGGFTGCVTASARHLSHHTEMAKPRGGFISRAPAAAGKATRHLWGGFSDGSDSDPSNPDS
ncbi:hypothetical protein HDU96_009342 [Phlyctochytrium bullatum]|nr:hypothetical protein HDU96_009342 [Phlyctochytrium bullatum]